MSHPDPDWWGKCRCWRPGWLGGHDDPSCEFLLEEKLRQEKLRQEKAEKEENEKEKGASPLSIKR